MTIGELLDASIDYFSNSEDEECIIYISDKIYKIMALGLMGMNVINKSNEEPKHIYILTKNIKAMIWPISMHKDLVEFVGNELQKKIKE